MLKFGGCFLILLASIGSAYSIYKELRQHLKLLYEVRNLLSNLFWEMSYSIQPIETILLYHVKTTDEKLLRICEEIGTNLLKKEAASGGEVWRKCFASHRQELGLREEESEIIELAGSAYFGKSIEENKKMLNLYLERLDYLIEGERKERKEKQKVYQTICIMSGLVLIILLV